MFLIKVIQALEKHQVQYALVGGLAVSLHGAVRGTVDIDLVIRLQEKEFLEAEKAFQELGLLPKLPVDGKQVFRFRKEYIEVRNLIAWSFYNPKTPLESVDVIITHGAEDFDVETFTAFGTKIRVASVPDLIRMKTLAGREQDLADIRALKRLKK